MLNELQLVLVQFQPLPHVLIVFNELGGGEAHRQAGGLGVVLNLVDHRVDAAVHRAGLITCITSHRAKIYAPGRFPIACHMERVTDQLLDALIFDCGNRDNGNT